MDWESARYSDNRARGSFRARRVTDVAFAIAMLGSLVTILVVGAGCATLFNPGEGQGNLGKPIENPFADAQWLDRQARDRVIFRSKKGSRALEVELPGDQPQFQDFMVPVSPEFAATEPAARGPASVGGSVDQSYETRGQTLTDMEILQTLPQGDPTHDAARDEIEQDLGLKAVEDTAPRSESSYLAALDKIKQLFNVGRYEAALIEADQMLRLYPTDAKLYEMRGTLLDRLGHASLAIRSWQQAVKLNPNNRSLKMYLDQKSEKANWRKVSSE